MLLGLGGPWLVLNLAHAARVSLALFHSLLGGLQILAVAISLFIVAILASKRHLDAKHTALLLGMFAVFMFVILSSVAAAPQ